MTRIERLEIEIKKTNVFIERLQKRVKKQTDELERRKAEQQQTTPTVAA